MYLSISENGSLTLEDINTFNSFSIKEEKKPTIQGDFATALNAIAEPADDNHHWLDANSVIALSSRKNDSEWVDAFWKMLKSVEPYGFSNIDKKLIKAHVEREDKRA